MGEDCILFLMFCSSRAGGCHALLFFFLRDVRQKERRDGEGGILKEGKRVGVGAGVGGVERWRGC